MADVVLLTGVSRYLGGRVARVLSTSGLVERVIGVDVVPPTHDIGDAEFVRADIRNPVISKIIATEDVDTVVHMNVIATPTFVGGRSSQKEINVIGTMQLLAACQKAESVQRLVVKSSTSVYGSSSRDPAMFTEDMGPQRQPRAGFGKDSMEVEGYVRGFSRRRPDTAIHLIRFANCIGPSIRTSLTDYFTLPVVPTPLGFDARLQFLHEDDLVRAMVESTVGDHEGIVNVAGDGVITLAQAVALVGRPSVPVVAQAAGMIGGMFKRFGLADFSPDQMSLLSYGRGVDTTRMREAFGFEPEFTTREAFETFAAAVRESGYQLTGRSA
ncbi:MAG: NAD-dependent epimerase/dehydratase family protein [Intrasporangiaceae bacterium]|nr:NAD-dependent epimerase/dehydratase family protein [Intrasporangiaceae bacterium]